MKIVKSVDKNETWVLVKTVTPAKDAITGPVMPFDAEALQKFAEAQNKKTSPQ
jgi:hypothetical protein